MPCFISADSGNSHRNQCALPCAGHSVSEFIQRYACRPLYLFVQPLHACNDSYRLPFDRPLWRNDDDEHRYVLTAPLQNVDLKKQFIRYVDRIFAGCVFRSDSSYRFCRYQQSPRRAYLYCALIAAAGHSTRFLLMNESLTGMHIVPATSIAALIVGVLAVLFSPLVRTPAETCLFPSLLPMIPGIYAYRTFGGLVMCLYQGHELGFNHYFYLFASNGLTCLFILLRNGHRCDNTDLPFEKYIFPGHTMNYTCHVNIILLTFSFSFPESWNCAS